MFRSASANGIANKDQEEQVKHASDKMRLNARINLFFHKSGFASAAVRFFFTVEATAAVLG